MLRLILLSGPGDGQGSAYPIHRRVKGGAALNRAKEQSKHREQDHRDDKTTLERQHQHSGQ